MLQFLNKKFNILISDRSFSEILTGSVWALAARIAATGIGLIISIIVARFYGASVMGILAVLQSFLMLATIFTVLGTNTSLLRLIPEHLIMYSPSSAFCVYRKTQFIVVTVSLITGTLFYIFSGFVAKVIFSKPNLSFFFALASIFVVFKSLMILNTQAVRGLRLIKAFALMQIFPQGFNLLLLLLMHYFFNSINVPIYAMLGGFTLTGLIGWIIMVYSFQKQMQPSDYVKVIAIKEIVTVSLPMLMTATMNFFVGQTGVIILGMFRSEKEMGYYAVAVKLSTLTSFILSAINSIAGPKFSELFHSNKIDELFQMAKKSAKLIFWTTVPILLGIVIFGKIILQIAFGKDFTVAYLAMVLLTIGQFVNSVSGATGLFMNMTGNQIVLRNIVFIGAIANILLNFFFIPKYGIYGAAISTMINLIGWNISILFYIKLKYGKITGYLPFIMT